MRDKGIDLLKGLGIFFMVAIHARCYGLYWGSMFHMAIFFIASGFLFNGEKVNSVKNLLKYYFRKLKGLWLPYVAFSILFILLNNVFIKMNIYTDNVNFANSNVEGGGFLGTYMGINDILHNIYYALTFQYFCQIGGAFWFFRTLFFVLIIYSTIEFLLRKVINNKNMVFCIQGIISLLLLTLGYYYSIYNKKLPYDVEKVFLVYCLIFIGQVIRKYDVTSILIKKVNTLTKIIYVILLTVLFIVNYNLFNIRIDISSDQIFNPIVFIFASICGFLYLYLIADLLLVKNIKIVDYINSFIANLSIHSVSIIALHFLCFKIINYFGVLLLNKELYLVAAFPVLFKGDFCWILYTAVGLVIPLLLTYIFITLEKLFLKVKCFN